MEELNAIYERMRAIFAEEAGFVPNDGCGATLEFDPADLVEDEEEKDD